MRIIGCDLHAAQQTIAMLDGETGEVSERTRLKGSGVLSRVAGAGGGCNLRDRVDGMVPAVNGGAED
jgi:hypothetical protein